MKTYRCYCFLAALLGVLFASETRAQISAFTYQGSLLEQGLPANGHYDFRFELKHPKGAIGTLTNTAVEVSRGLFTVLLDFGPEAFLGHADLLLEIGVVTNGGGPFVLLNPPQPVTHVPLALTAENAFTADSVSGDVLASQLTGLISPDNIGAESISSEMLSAGAVGTEQLASGTVFNGSFVGDASSLSNLNSSRLSGPLTFDAGKLVMVGHINDGGNARSVAVSGPYAFLANNDDGLRSYDLSDPAYPVNVGHIDNGAYARDVAVSGNHGYVANSDDGLRVYDLSDPANLVNIGHAYDGGNAQGLAISGQYLYLANFNDGLRIYDIQDPANPVSIGHTNDAGNARDIAVSGDYAFLANENDGLRVYDVSNPASPSNVGHIDNNGGYALGIAVLGNHAYLANTTDGLRIYDISDPSNPVNIGHIDDGASASDVAVSGGYAYLANDADGLRVYDISDPVNPEGVGLVNDGGVATGIAVEGGFAFLASDADGLRIYAIGSMSAFGFVGNGSGLTALSASQLSSGIIPSERLSGTYSDILNFSNSENTFDGAFRGDGSELVGINALDAADGSPTNAVYVDDNGYVGVGTGRPVSALQVVGTVTADRFDGAFGADQLTGSIVPTNIAPGTITSSMLAAESVTSTQLAIGAVTTKNLADKAVTAEKIFNVPVVRDYIEVPNPDPAADDKFGRRVAAVGEARFIVGVPDDDRGAMDAGVAYLYDLQGQFITTFTNPAPDVGDNFGMAVAALGEDKVLIGAPGDDTGATNTGIVYLFDLQGNRILTFTNPVPNEFDNFGVSVAGIDDKVAIGADYADVGGTDTGIVYLFNQLGEVVSEFYNPVPNDGDHFGGSLAAVGSDRLVIGAHRADAGANASGAAYLFETTERHLATFTNPEPTAYDFFGRDLAVVGTSWVVIGVPTDDFGAENSGSVYVFDMGGNLVRTIANPAPAADDRFGRVAALGTDRILVGAWLDDLNSVDSGAAYAFDMGGNLLTTFPNPTSTGHTWFGTTVIGVGTDHVLVGATRDNTGAPQAGMVHLYDLMQVAPDVIVQQVAPGVIDTASLADGAVTPDKVDPDVRSQLATPDGSVSGVVQVSEGGLVGIGTDQPEAGLEIRGGRDMVSLEVLTTVVDEMDGYTTLNGAYDLAIEGDLLAVSSSYDSGITLINVSDMANPILRSQFRQDDEVFTNFNNIAGIDLSGSVLAVAARWPGAVTLVNVANPYIPSRYSLLQDGFAGFNELNGAADVAIEGNLLAVAATDDDAVTLVDISNPANPQLRAVLKDGSFGFTELNGATNVALAGNLLAIAGFWDNAVTLVDVSDPANPRLQSVLIDGIQYDELYRPSSVSLSGNLLAITSTRRSAVTLVDITNPAEPVGLSVVKQMVGGFNDILRPREAIISGQILAICAQGGNAVTLADISDPTRPRVLGVARQGVGGVRAMAAPAGIAFHNGDLAVASILSRSVSFLRPAPIQSGLVSHGWVGVGTTAPLAPLHVRGNVLVEDADSVTLETSHFASGLGTLASGGTSTAMGSYTVASGPASTAMGSSTTASGHYSTSMGYATAANGYNATVLGFYSKANGDHSLALGHRVTANGDHSMTLGFRAESNHKGSLVWGSAVYGSSLTTDSTNDYSVTMRALGGYRLLSSSNNVGAYLAPGSGSWTSMSDRHAKEEIQPVNLLEMLEKVTTLPVSTWKYKSQDTSVRHIGPMAQDFKAVFGVGECETGISTVDADGVALAAIQGLNLKLEEQLRVKEARINELERRLEALERRLSE